MPSRCGNKRCTKKQQAFFSLTYGRLWWCSRHCFFSDKDKEGMDADMSDAMCKSSFLEYVESNSSYKESLTERREKGRVALARLRRIPDADCKTESLDGKTKLRQFLEENGYVITKSPLNAHILRKLFYNESGTALTFNKDKLKQRKPIKKKRNTNTARATRWELQTVFDDFVTTDGHCHPVASGERQQFQITDYSEVDSEMLSKIMGSVPLPDGAVIHGAACLGRTKNVVADQCLHRDASDGYSALFALTPNYKVAVLPGSHKTEDEEHAVYDVTNLVHICLQPGDLLVFDARLIHSGLRASSRDENPYTLPLTDWVDVSLHAYLTTSDDFTDDPSSTSLPVWVKLGDDGEPVFGKHLSPQNIVTKVRDSRLCKKLS